MTLYQLMGLVWKKELEPVLRSNEAWKEFLDSYLIGDEIARYKERYFAKLPEDLVISALSRSKRTFVCHLIQLGRFDDYTTINAISLLEAYRRYGADAVTEAVERRKYEFPGVATTQENSKMTFLQLFGVVRKDVEPVLRSNEAWKDYLDWYLMGPELWRYTYKDKWLAKVPEDLVIGALSRSNRAFACHLIHLGSSEEYEYTTINAISLVEAYRRYGADAVENAVERGEYEFTTVITAAPNGK